MSNTSAGEAAGTARARRQALERLRGSLAGLRAGQLTPAALVEAFRTETALLAGLPPAFASVVENTLQRLESSGLFAEESCSFSQQGLLENLDLWIEKADKRLCGD